MEKILYKLDAFEGPLDLLLHLIQKHKVSIYDIPIADITDRYIEAIGGLDNEDLDETSEFVVMAAELLYIKSKMLLPKPEKEEDEEDPREDLVKRLEEYKLYKEMSHELRKTEFSARDKAFKDAEKIEFPTPPYNKTHRPSDLTDAFYAILERRKRTAKPEKRAFYGIVGREKVSVEAMEDKVTHILSGTGQAAFSELFLPEDSRPEMIATFIAVLEMIKLAKITAEYDETRDEFVITASVNK